jgi:dihydropteroate synthase
VRGVRADLAGVKVGDGLPVAIMGVVNVSPESFHAGSVYRGEDAMVRAALEMVEAGATLIDVGARSTAPYLETEIDEATETARLGRAVELLAAKLPVPVSADTSRPGPARAALEAGARVINDVSTLSDRALARLVASRPIGLVVMASPGGGRKADRGRRPARPRKLGRGSRQPTPVATVTRILAGGLQRARAAGIPRERIVVDPGIGFFRSAGTPWHTWDVRVLAGLRALRELARPICVGVSRKSFIGAIAERAETGQRLAGSLAATAVAVCNGAALVRTHDVAETRDAVRLAERLRDAGR